MTDRSDQEESGRPPATPKMVSQAPAIVAELGIIGAVRLPSCSPSLPSFSSCLNDIKLTAWRQYLLSCSLSTVS